MGARDRDAARRRMSGEAPLCSSHEYIALSDGWELAAAPAGRLTDPEMLAAAALTWVPADVPGTVASSLLRAGVWNFESRRRFDAEDWWYRLRFAAPAVAAGDQLWLCFDGLATLAQVWLNGRLALESDNMFVRHEVQIGSIAPQPARAHDLLIRFRSLDTELQVRRPRPRWRTPMVEQQQLRWFRTTLLGRTPGWSPPAAAVGPWQAVRLERRRRLDIEPLALRAELLPDGCGALSVECALRPVGGTVVRQARLRIDPIDTDADRDGRVVAGGESDLLRDAGTDTWCGQCLLPTVRRWWPHTHGTPALYRAWLEVTLTAQTASAPIVFELGRVGFRSVQLDRSAGDFALHINGQTVFCRGACWMPLDVTTLRADAEVYRRTIEQVRAAGMNMLRVCGPTVYEDDVFLDLCDRYGVLVWQDFMFANMDYPAEDAAFVQNVEREAAQQLARLRAHPSVAVLCGNSEVGQQAAMSGAPRAAWVPPLFGQRLAALAAAQCPAVPYVPSSTDGGAFPHQPSAGVTSYYGVGAYLRPVSDARRSDVRFASEALAFANVPEAQTLELISDALPRVHHPHWKERVPRDLGAGWDFDDVRDHYLQQCFGVSPMPLRYADHERYLRLSRVASAEVMAAAFDEWRRAGSRCRGALVWTLRDLWPGAGWGVIDSTGLPKAAYYYLKRVCQPLSLHILDEGNNGLVVHLVNETSEALAVRLELARYYWTDPVGPALSRELVLAPRSTTPVPAAELVDDFVDLSYAFRFGPPSYDVLRATLTQRGGSHGVRHTDANELITVQRCHFPCGLPQRLEASLGVVATATVASTGEIVLDINAARFAQAVHIEAPGYVADDQYFHLLPNDSRRVRLQPIGPTRTRPAVVLRALNSSAGYRVNVPT